ncbi:hypothetical protein CUC15_08245 [Oceanobacillus zhaokaii]|uniref:Amino acid ABC transporter substrate-binding protein n=1 Tax=Oceanobacillus zhaokaii TaxID=2052660 RepID=A0A345PFX5_9BACI|nr:hypothetical protein [Oceanobacillus zhaokaii]AXI08905.1 hypothetical protein CUC15_08245 [Oceanobacillus zhaokaii]
MKKIWLLVVFCAFNPLGACGDSSEKEISSEKSNNADEKWAEIQDAGEIVVGNSGTLFPASYYEGGEGIVDKLTGYNVELMREIANRHELDI